ncbi:MAG TPA: VOC family protein [Ktedonobacterales bacterium]|nr:VOC family protein [Ktedonobacterales bacterium]
MAQETHQQGTSANAAVIDPATQVGLVALTVADLGRSLTFYTDIFGFTLLDQKAAAATLGTPSAPLLLLREEAGARPWPHDQYAYTGLYHFAVLVPTRRDLGRWLRHWLQLGLPLPGQGDHLVSEALYISDPDGNGIEIYRDRPRSEWHWDDGQVRMAVDPVDIRGVLGEAEKDDEPWAGFPDGTRVGHIHLQIGDVPKAKVFYHDVLGFDIVASMPSALFVSAGGYHHHIGMNIWHSRNAPPAPAGTAGLRFFTLEIPSEEARSAIVARLDAADIPSTQTPDAVIVQDPWQNTLALQIGPAGNATNAEKLATAAQK